MAEVAKAKVFGPLSGFAEGFADYLSGLGYAPTSVVLRLNMLNHLSRWLAAEGVQPVGFDAGMIERFVNARRLDHVDLSSARALVPLLAFLRSVGAIPDPVAPVGPGTPMDVVLAQWCEFLARERGLQGSSIRYYRDLARPFLVSRMCGDGMNFAGLDARAVSAFVREHIPGMPIGMAKLTVTALRSLLRFLFAAGLTTERLDGAVPARAGYRDSGLPKGLAPAQLEALISAIDPGTDTGKRDLAIVVLLARLGLRAAEVAALRLEDLDWRAATLRVPGKGGRIDVLPLPADVGEVLVEHLQVKRHPAAVGRALFFASLAPYLPLGHAGVQGVVRSAGMRTGLGTVGTHRLRHSVATATINAGASLEEVSQLLRHRHLSSTTIYAKVDLTHLTSLATPWPTHRPAAGAVDERA